MSEGRSETRPDGRRYWRELHRQKDEILNIRADAARHRTPLERVLAATAKRLADPTFFAAEVVFHLLWVALNAYLLPESLRWDPYPFSLLTGFASIQALFIGLLILMYEERSAAVDEIRQETELQVNLHTERETTKLLRMMAEVHHALGLRSQERDPELEQMEQPLDPARLRDHTEEQIDEAEREAEEE